MRSFSAALLVLCGFASQLQAQYTTYYHAAPYNTYANYVPGGYNGPMRALDWRWWSGVAPYSPAYGYPTGYDTAYTANYSPSYSSYYTASYYSPAYEVASYYGPSYASYGTTAFYPTVMSAINACCNPCGITACGGCATGLGDCATGNCGVNYTPNASSSPQPDPSSAPSSSGTQNFQNESNPEPAAGDPNAPPSDDGWGSSGDGQYNRSPDEPMDDGFGVGPTEETERGANYGPPESIRKRAPNPELKDPNGNGEPDASLFKPPVIDPEAVMPLVNRDSRISSTPSHHYQRRRMTARFGSPELARSEAAPKDIPAARDVKVVRK